MQQKIVYFFCKIYKSEVESAVRHGILVEKCCYHLHTCLRYAILKKHLSHLVPDGTNKEMSLRLSPQSVENKAIAGQARNDKTK